MASCVFPTLIWLDQSFTQKTTCLLVTYSDRQNSRGRIFWSIRRRFICPFLLFLPRTQSEETSRDSGFLSALLYQEPTGPVGRPWTRARCRLLSSPQMCSRRWKVCWITSAPTSAMSAEPGVQHRPSTETLARSCKSTLTRTSRSWTPTFMKLLYKISLPNCHWMTKTRTTQIRSKTTLRPCASSTASWESLMTVPRSALNRDRNFRPRPVDVATCLVLALSSVARPVVCVLEFSHPFATL